MGALILDNLLSDSLGRIRSIVQGSFSFVFVLSPCDVYIAWSDVAWPDDRVAPDTGL